MNIKKKNLTTIIYFIISVLVVIIILFPIINLIFTSLKSRLYILENVYPNYHFIPREIILNNYHSVLMHQKIFYPLYNSFIVSFLTASVVVIVSITGGYSFSRLKKRIIEIVIFILIFTRLVPAISMVIPYYILSQQIGLYDTRTILVIIHSAFLLPYSVLIIKGVMDKLPYELEESALIDGCNYWTTFLKIVVPLAKPGIVTVFIYTFLGTWNSFLMPLVLTARKIITIQIALSQNITYDEIRWNLLTATAVLALVPVVVLAIAFQKYIIGGLTEGSLKQ